MKKLELNKKQKKEALLNTAFELFTSKGIHKTSISDIVNSAGVAKGTFYLYFKDKYDIRNYLISKKAEQMFLSAHNALIAEQISEIEDQILFIIDHILDQLTDNPVLLTFISKNLSWGVFKNALIGGSERQAGGPAQNAFMDINDDSFNFLDVYKHLIQGSNRTFNEPEIMLFMIIELTSSTCYSSILYQEPVPIEELKPHLYAQIRHILEDHELPDKTTI